MPPQAEVPLDDGVEPAYDTYGFSAHVRDLERLLDRVHGAGS